VPAELLGGHFAVAGGFPVCIAKRAAYEWPDDPSQSTDETILERLLTLNGERACA